MQINIIDYGAVPDGMTDNFSVFQQAENALSFEGGEIIVPKGRYLVSEPFYHRSKVTLTGEGAESVILNNTPAEAGSDTNFCIQIGNFKPSSFARCTHYKVKDITAGQEFVKLPKTVDINIFAVGDCILVDSIAGFMGSDNDFKPYQAFINRISYIDRNQRVLYLEDPVTDSIVGAKVALTRNNNPREYICQFPVIQNIAFESNGDWSMRFGVYKGQFRNLWIKSTDIIPANGLSHCTFENIVAKFSQKVIEMATYSHDTTVYGLIAKWYDGFKDPANKPLIAMGENVRRCIYNDLQIDSGNMTNIGMIMRFEHAFSNRILNSSFTVQNIPGSAVEFSTTDDDSIVVNNEVSYNEFYLNTARAFIKADVANSFATVSSNVIEGNKFEGTVKKNEIGNALAQNNITNNSYNASV